MIGVSPVKLAALKAALAGVALLTASMASAAVLEGQRFDDSARLSNQDLTLNGVGLRAVFFIRGYVAGLYLQQKASTLREISTLTGPKRVQLRMLRKADPDDFIEALVEGIEENSTPSELASLNARIRQLEQIIKAIGTALVGDTINFDYVPGIGTTLTINGVRKGAAIEGADFYAAVLKIFIGEHPVDEKLKAGLLGR